MAPTTANAYEYNVSTHILFTAYISRGVRILERITFGEFGRKSGFFTCALTVVPWILLVVLEFYG